MPSKKRYSAEFKRKVLRELKRKPARQVQAEFGVLPKSCYLWQQEKEARSEQRAVRAGRFLGYHARLALLRATLKDVSARLRELKKHPALRQTIAAKCAFIERARGKEPLARYLQALSVPQGRRYTWLKKKKHDRQLVGAIVRINDELRGKCSPSMMLRELKMRGVRCGRERLVRVMREGGISTRGYDLAAMRKKSSAPPNRLLSPFRVTGSNRVWVGDMTFIRTREGYLQLSILLDLYSRRVVGWATGDRQNAELALNALGMALLQRSPKSGLIHHTDRGSAYASHAYQACLEKNGIVSSMSHAGRPVENAFAESFFRTLKEEIKGHPFFASHETAKNAIFEYIEIFYNRQRRHGSLSYVSPMEFEELAGHNSDSEPQ